MAQFQRQFGFRVFAHRSTEGTATSTRRESVAMCCNSILLVVEEVDPASSCCSEGVSDIIWHVPDIGKMYRRVTASGAVITSPLKSGQQESRESQQSSSSLTCSSSFFTIQSPFPSVQHTVIGGPCQCSLLAEKDGVGAGTSVSITSIACLPGFVPCTLDTRGSSCIICSSRFPLSCHNVLQPKTTHVDHVTFACHAGSANSLLTWYEKCLGFKQLHISSNGVSDTGENGGFIIRGDNGMRMVAMQWWQCSETAVLSPAANHPTLLVFAEPLHVAGKRVL